MTTRKAEDSLLYELAKGVMRRARAGKISPCEWIDVMLILETAIKERYPEWSGWRFSDPRLRGW